MNPCVYILLLENGNYYIGSTRDLNRRFKEHQRKDHAGTRYSMPLRILFSQECDTYSVARKIELKLKKLKVGKF